MTITLDQALATARQLVPRERAQLVARIVEELVEPATAPPTGAATDTWAQLWQVADEIGAAPRIGSRSATDEVSAARR